MSNPHPFPALINKDKKMTIANVTKSFLNTNTHNAFLFLFLLSLGQCYDLETFGISSIFSFEFVKNWRSERV